MRLIDKKKQKSFFDQFDNSKIFEFVREDYKFIIVGYPYWRAYITTLDDRFRIEVYPVINVKTSKIDFPKEGIFRQIQNAGNETEEHSAISSEVLLLCDKDLKTESEFFNHIPKEIIQYATTFAGSHWELLKALTYFGDNFRVLFSTNPALAYLIVNMENLNPAYSFYNHLSYVEHLITNKQKEILARAGFPGNERLVKIFSKIEPHSLETQHLLGFRNSIKVSNPAI